MVPKGAELESGCGAERGEKEKEKGGERVQGVGAENRRGAYYRLDSMFLCLLYGTRLRSLSVNASAGAFCTHIYGLILSYPYMLSYIPLVHSCLFPLYRKA